MISEELTNWMKHDFWPRLTAVADAQDRDGLIELFRSCTPEQLDIVEKAINIGAQVMQTDLNLPPEVQALFDQRRAERTGSQSVQ